MSLVRFTLTTPADKAVSDRISMVMDQFDSWVETLRERKIDVQHAVAMKRRLQSLEGDLKAFQDSPITDPVLLLSGNVTGGVPNEVHFAVRAQRIYFRALVLELLDAEDAWERKQAAKRAMKEST